MNLWIAEHYGTWLSGYSFVIAETELEAMRYFRALLKESWPHKHPDDLKVERIRAYPLTPGKPVMIWDGDY
jgi:hypothetical protein